MVHRKKHMYVFLIIIPLALVAIILLISLNKLEKLHYEEIKKVITNNGGVVTKIEKTNAEQSPFATDYNKSNVIYKVSYTNNQGVELVAWYRGVNVVNDIHAPNPTSLQGGYGEKWILPYQE